jgi:hypothetical protein
MQRRNLSKTVTIGLLTGTIIAYFVLLCTWGRATLSRKCAIDYGTRLLAAHECFKIQYKKLLYEQEKPRNDQNGSDKNGSSATSTLLSDKQCETNVLTEIQQEGMNEGTTKPQTTQLKASALKASAEMVKQFQEQWKKGSLEQAEVHIRDVAENLRIAFANHLLPFAIDDESQEEILDYPGLFINPDTPPDCPPETNCRKPFNPNQQATIIALSKKVGRIALIPDYSKKSPRLRRDLMGHYIQDCVTAPQGYAPAGKCNPYFWGTAFVIAKGGVIATSCHQLDPLIRKDRGNFNLVLEDTKLILDFGYTTADYGHQPQDAKNDGQWEVEKLIDCGDREGLDIALLQLKPKHDSYDHPYYPDPVQLYTGPKELFSGTDEKTNHPLALIGYADLEHFADSVTERLYRIFTAKRVVDKNYPKPYTPAYYNHDKFALLDWTVPVPECIGYAEQVLHVASTTVGASGAVLVGINSDDQQTYGKVVAMHTCCSKYFSEPQGTAPISDLPCARLTRTFDNQALGVWTILSDQRLCADLHSKDSNILCFS